MKLLEAIIGVFLLSILLVGGASILVTSQTKFSDFSAKLQEDAKKISLFNYSKHLVKSTVANQTGFININGTAFQTGNSGEFYYECSLKTGNKIQISQAYSGIFCQIDYKKEKLYNYRLFKY